MLPFSLGCLRRSLLAAAKSIVTAPAEPRKLVVDRARPVLAPPQPTWSSEAWPQPVRNRVAQLLQDTTTKNTTTSSRIAALNSVLVDPLYTTRTQQKLFEAVLQHCAHLADGDFEGSNGAHARLVLGAQGIGKSHVLRTFTHLCEGLFPSIIPIFVTFNDLVTNRQPKALAEHLVQRLEERGVKVDRTEDNLCVAVVEALKRTNKRLLVMVDEIDQFYRVGPDTPQLFEAASRSLGALAFFGDRPGGRVAVLLCSSSAVCPLLVTCNAFIDLHREFPLLTCCPNLNGQKYRVWRMPSPLPHDLDDVRTVLQLRCKAIPPAALDQVTRLVAFVSGSSFQYLHHQIGKDTLHINSAALSSRFAEGSESALRGALNGVGGQLYGMVKLKLRSKNEEVINELLSLGEADPEKIANKPWEKMLQPVSWEELKAMWALLHSNDAERGKDLSALQEQVLALCDRNYIVYDEIVSGAPHNVFPVACAQLILPSDAPSDLSLVFDAFAKRLVAYFHKMRWERYLQLTM